MLASKNKKSLSLLLHFAYNKQMNGCCIMNMCMFIIAWVTLFCLIGWWIGQVVMTSTANNY